MIPPGDWAAIVAQLREELQAGRLSRDHQLPGDPMPLSEWTRLCKLVEAVGDRERVRQAKGIDPARWARLEHAWGMARFDPAIWVRSSAFWEELDVTEEAARLREVAPGLSVRDTPPTQLLEAGDVTVRPGPGRAPCAFGRFLRRGHPPFWRCVDLQQRRVLWEVPLTADADHHHRPGSDDPVFVGDRAFLLRHAELLAVDVATGAARWSVSLPGTRAVERGALVQPLAGALVVASRDAGGTCVLGLNDGDGRQMWRIGALPAVEAMHAIPGFGVALHTAGPAGKHAVVIDARSGAARWIGPQADGDPSSVGSVAVDDAGTLRLAMHDPTRGVAWPAATSELRVDPRSDRRTTITVEPPFGVHPRPAVFPEETVWPSAARGRIVVVTPPIRGGLRELYRATPGSTTEVLLPEPEEWMVRELQRAGDALAVLAGGHMHGRQRLLRLEMATRTWHRLAEWRHMAECANPAAGLGHPRLAVQGGLVVVAMGEERPRPPSLAAFDLTRGAQMWSVSVPGWVEHRFLGGLLYVDTADGGWAVDPTTGARAAHWP